MFTFINGQFIPSENAVISVDDLALHRGYGVTDFFLCIDGVPLYIEQHLDRLYQSMSDFYLNIPYTKTQLHEFIIELAARCNHRSLSIKVIVTGGNSFDNFTPAEEANCMIVAKPFTPVNNAVGLKLMLVNYERELYSTKTVNYAFSIQQLKNIKAQGFQDMLFHKDGHISESSRSNAFVVKNGILFTPNKGALKGITRENTLDEALKLGIETSIQPISLEDLVRADEIFLTSTTRQIHPVVQVNENYYRIGEMTLRLQKALQNRESSYLKTNLLQKV